MNRLQRFFLLVALLGLAACSPARVLAPTPNIFANDGYPLSEIPAVYQTAQPKIFYITDRGKTNEDGFLSYGSERSSSMAFGASTVAFGEDQNWQSLGTASGMLDRSEKIKLNLVKNEEILRFDKTPTPFKIVNGKPVLVPEAVKSYNRKRAEFQGQIREQMRLSGKNEVVVFVPGFNNSFEDGLYALADIWHFSGRHGVPILYSWPAGAGGLFGYLRDRESGEFTVFHLKEFLSQLSQIPELRKIHIVAHSRGTDVTTTALREMIIAERSQGKNPNEVLKIANLILAAPDLDFSIVRQRLIAEGFGASIGKITVYINRGDSALGVSQRLATGRRLGTLTADRLKPAEKEIFSEVKTVSFVNVEGVKGLTGHSYYRTNRNALSDIATIIRENAPPGSPSRPLVRVEGNFWNMPKEYPF
ncbi:MAG: alpha/beta hydrolase [Tateyamaria sp.]|uniref:alpha/beta hydrolase n=1 Tax=Tateyamaria sp. TaxID=1929288 RepID=UPI00329CB708